MIRPAYAAARRVGRSVRDTMLRMGIGPRLRDDNRRVLETQLLPRIASDPSVERVLFIGCHWYTWHYEKLFYDNVGEAPRSVEFCTIDVDPERARYGASRHVVGSAEDLRKYYPENSFDCVMLIGVIGWGVDDAESAERVLAECAAVLRKDGELILGVDEVPERMPFVLEDLKALDLFAPDSCSTLKVHRHRCGGDLKHTYTFWRRLQVLLVGSEEYSVLLSLL